VICFSPRNMSSDDSSPRVRQRTEELVVDRLHRMQSWQVLLDRNLLRIDLRDPVLLPDVVFCLPKYINNKINHSQ
jgi:hypothetical protein